MVLSVSMGGAFSYTVDHDPTRISAELYNEIKERTGARKMCVHRNGIYMKLGTTLLRDNTSYLVRTGKIAPSNGSAVSVTLAFLHHAV